jgi:site-specific recombinase XerD
LDHFQQLCTAEGLSGTATRLLSSATRPSTNKAYDCAWAKWNSWCNRRKINPISANIKDILTFLGDQFDKDLQYRTVNVLRSAISSIHPWIDGKPVGQHALVTRLKKGIANERPPMPRYTTTWDVAKVTTYLSTLGENKTLSLKLLTKKLLMLLALVSPERSSVLWELDIRQLRAQPDGMIFTLTKPRKSGDPMSPATATFPRFLQDVTLCPCDCLETYLKATENFRSTEESSRLFLSFQRPHRPVAKATITRWMCDVLYAAGIDSTIFKAHSTRAASTSAAAKKHLPLDDIIKMGDWTSPSTFQRFYYKPTIDDAYARTILTQ